jgi:hypothetical protein
VIRHVLALCFVLAGTFACDPGSTDPPATGSELRCTRWGAVCEGTSGLDLGCRCESTAQCATGECILAGKYCTKVCLAPALEVKLGDRCDCDDTCPAGATCRQQCVVGTFCKNLGVESRCAPLLARGESCLRGSTTTPCATGLRCTAKPGVLEGTCEPYPSKGEPCADDGLCTEGLICWDGTCAEPRKAGEPCRSELDCAAFATCSGPCAGGTCCSAPLIGKACTSGADCPHQLVFCSRLDGTCHAKAHADAACDPAEAPEQCPFNPPYYATRCDPTSRVCADVRCSL